MKTSLVLSLSFPVITILPNLWMLHSARSLQTQRGTELVSERTSAIKVNAWEFAVCFTLFLPVRWNSEYKGDCGNQTQILTCTTNSGAWVH